eukprot:4883032-Pyramimonas_sp.AAC.1
MCSQETRRPNSDRCAAQSGFLIVRSCTAGVSTEHAGTGSTVAPWARTRVQGFRQLDSRIASIKIKTAMVG